MGPQGRPEVAGERTIGLEAIMTSWTVFGHCAVLTYLVPPGD